MLLWSKSMALFRNNPDIILANNWVSYLLSMDSKHHFHALTADGF
jgi:hypothetical protein